MKFEIVAIGEVKPDFVSSRIQRFLGTDYSHIGILVGGDWLYHATGLGFHAVPWALYEPGHVIRERFAVELTDPQEIGYALGWLKGADGHEYSQSQYLGFLFPFLRRFVANKNSKTVCSEAAGQFMFDCLGIKDSRLYQADWLCPKALVEVCRERIR